MRQPVKRSSPPGFLLVEAVFSAVLIAVGLVFINRGLSGQLQAVRTVEDYETLLSLAQSKLAELESARLFNRAIPPDANGLFGVPYQNYRWTIRAVPREDLKNDADQPIAAEVTITVQRAAERSSVVSLSAIWCADWVPPEWF